ncbi:MAG: RNA methyltransferase [Bacteroidales bacterium]|nr:RNA methyltransferase [Bacteroidales bacterium]
MKDRKLLNTELGRLTPEAYTRSKSGVVVILDNVRSAHNVGSVFRSADCFKADALWLCGITPVPPSPLIRKTALGAEDVVPYVYVEDTLAAVRRLKDDGYTLVAVEQTLHSISLETFVPQSGRRYAYVFGNEVDGVRQDVVDACDVSLEIPQFGTKHSLNVSVAAGVVLWHCSGKQQGLTKNSFCQPL